MTIFLIFESENADDIKIKPVNALPRAAEAGGFVLWISQANFTISVVIELTIIKLLYLALTRFTIS
jgi:hypothetical protein